MHSIWCCASQYSTSALYQSCEAHSRVGAHLSKLWQEILVGRSFTRLQYIAYLIVHAYGINLTIGRDNRYPWWSSPGILHCATVRPHNVTLTHWWVNGEHCLVGTHNRIHYSLGLLVGSIESYYSTISPPGDNSSRSTIGRAGERPGLIIISQVGYPWQTWK